MTQDDQQEPAVTPLTPVTNVSRQVARYREARSWTTTYLAARCALLGMPSLDRQALTNIEAGKRKRIGVDELLVLAAALGIAPTHLLVPPDDGPYAVVPARVTNAGRAREWVRGNYPLHFSTLPMDPSRDPVSAVNENHDVAMYVTVNRSVQEWEPPPRDNPVGTPDIDAIRDAIEDGAIHVSQSPTGQWVFAQPHEPTEPING